jgi:hypothetical protein
VTPAPMGRCTAVRNSVITAAAIAIAGSARFLYRAHADVPAASARCALGATLVGLPADDVPPGRCLNGPPLGDDNVVEMWAIGSRLLWAVWWSSGRLRDVGRSFSARSVSLTGKGDLANPKVVLSPD